MQRILKSIQSTYHKVVSEETRLSLYQNAPKPLRNQWDKVGRPFNQVTKKDIYYCHRLLLRREPTSEELNHWFKMTTNFHFDIDRLVHHFLYGDEFIKLQAAENQPVCIDLEAFKLFVRKNDYATGASIARHKTYEPLVAEQIKQRLSPGDTFIDIGANVGYHAMLAASVVGKSGKIIAFEPLPSNCELIKQSIAENNFEHVTLYPHAVGEKEDNLKLMVEGSYSNAHLQTASDKSLYYKEAEGNQVVTLDGFLSNLIDVRVVALDNFLTDIDRIDMVKIDIEGVEPLAWRGMENLLRTHRPMVLTEFFPEYIKRSCQMEPEIYLDMMEQQEYDIVILDRRSGHIVSTSSKAEIMQIFLQSGTTHLDLLTIPR